MNGKLDIESKRLRMEGGVACSIRKSSSCSQKPNFCGDTNSLFIDIFLHQSKPIFVTLLHRPSSKPEFIERLDTQQTFVVFVFRRRLDEDEHVRYTDTSSEDVLIKTNIFTCLGHTSSKRLQDIFKKSCKDIFKTLSRGIIKLYCFCKQVFKMSSRRIHNISEARCNRRLSTEGFA